MRWLGCIINTAYGILVYKMRATLARKVVKKSMFIRRPSRHAFFMALEQIAITRVQMKQNEGQKRK